MRETLSPPRKILLWGILAAILAGNALSLFLSWTKQQQVKAVLAFFGQAPDFSLTERSGQTFSRSDLAGKIWIADFIFTSCAGQCPLMSLQMRKLQGEFPNRTSLRFVSFTVDPERDTPEVLSKYADRYRAEKERWFFLTGPKEEMNRILKGFFLSPVDEPMMHSIRFILVDAQGGIRGLYDSSEPRSMKQLIHDARILINQPSLRGGPAGRRSNPIARLLRPPSADSQ